MTFSLGGSDELTELAKAIGLLTENGDLDTSWFSTPLARLQGIVRAPAQRSALIRFCDLALPPVAQPGRPTAEKWHPLLGAQPNGNLFLTLTDTGSGILLGIGGDYHSSAAAAVPGRLRVQADFIAGSSTLDLVIGTQQHPILVEARVEPGWVYNPGGGTPVGLAAIVARATIVPDPNHPSFGLEVVLEQLSLGGEPPVDKVLDVSQLGEEAPDLLAALLKVVLNAVDVDPTFVMLADHLLGLLGLADADNIPAFPFAELGQGLAALQTWLSTLSGASGDPDTIGPWLEHLAGLLGAGQPFSGTGTLVDPWTVRLVDLAGIGELLGTVALVGDPQHDPHLRFGLAVSAGASLGANQPEIGAQGQCAIADVPLAGTGHARVLPEAAALLRVTGSNGAALLDVAAVKVGTIQAGIRWDGSTLKPTLELLDNRLDTVPYPVLDLTNVDSVAQAAESLVASAIEAALGTNVGRRIAAIAGLVPPEDPANPGNPIGGWGHQLDLTTLVTDPARAIESYHRAVLRDATNWTLILREIGQLIGLAGAIGGTGTETDPWTLTIAVAGAPELQIAAWHQPSPDAATTEQLRLALRLAATPAGATLALTSEVLSFDLPATGGATVRFVGPQRLSLVLSPAVHAVAGPIELNLDSLTLAAGWAPGQPFGWEFHAHQLTLAADGDSLTINDLHLPPTGPFDLTDLTTAAGSLGLSVTDLENALRLVLSMLAELAGPEAELATAFLGLHRRLPGLSADFPLLVDPAQPGLTLTDPLGALRSWLSRLLAHVGEDGQVGVAVLLQYLASLGTDVLAQLTGAVGTDFLPQLPSFLVGGATFADPWRVPWPGGGKDAEGEQVGPDLELWLEPGGPPAGWIAGLRTRRADATDLDGLAEVLIQLGWFDPTVRSLVKGLTVRDLTERLRGLQLQLNAGDGVIPLDSQSPDIFGWVHEVEVDAAHPLLPKHPDAITEILIRIETLHGAGPRTVLLIGPSYADHTVWDDLLASPTLQGPTDPGAHFDLRAAGIDPRTIALDSVTAVADYYTADLADDRRGDVSFLTAQIAHVADRLAVLHPGPLILVAHSYAGLAARRFAVDQPTRVQGLITLGTPHVGTPLTFLTDPELGDAVRVANALRPNLPASPLRDALDHLAHALEGYLPPTSPGGLAIPDPYPAASFTLAAPYDMGDVPVITIGGLLTDDVFTFLQAGLDGYLQALAGVPRPAPTHIGYGVSMPMALGNPVFGTPQAEARVRFGLGQIPLGSPPPALRPAQLLRVELDLFRGVGWLVGGPGLSDVDGRLRRIQVGLTASHGSSGVQAALDATLDQAAWRGTTVARAELTDARATSLVGAAFDAVLSAADSSQLPVSSLAAALSALDLITTNAQGLTGLSADGFAGLRTDPVGYLRARIPAALARPDGWAGLVADPSAENAYLWDPPTSPYALFARLQGDGSWRTGIEASLNTVVDATNAVDLGVAIDLLLPAFQPTAEVFVNLGPVSLHYRTADGTISLDAPPWITGLVLWPTPTLPDLAAQLATALPQVLTSGVLSTVLSSFVPGLRIGPLQLLLAAPSDFFFGVGALGHVDGGLDPNKLGGLLTSLNDAIGLPAGPGLQLPGDVSVTVGPGSAPQSARITVATTAPIGGVLGLGFSLEIDALRHVSPGGTVTVATPLTAGTWPQVSITFGVGPTGVTLVVTPQGVDPITLLPTFSGLGALRGAAAGLLPAVLDAAVGEFANPKPAWLTQLLAAAAALDLYDTAGKFSAHTSAFTAMLTGTWFDDIDQTKRANLAAAVVQLLNLVPGLPPSTLTSNAGLVRWTYALPAGQGTISLGAGWGTDGPTVQLGVANLTPTDAPLSLTASLGIDDTGLDVSCGLGVDLSSLGVTVIPRLAIALDIATSTTFAVRFLPLASSTADGPLVINLAPTFGIADAPATAETLLTGFALPLAVKVAVAALQPMLGTALWTGGPTLQQALTNAGLIGGSTLPNVFEMLAGFLVTASSALDLALADLHLKLVDHSNRIGIGLSGHQDIPLGDLLLSIRFGAPAAWGTAAAEGLQILFLDTSGPDPAFNFGLELHGVGIGLAKSDGTALIAETFIRLGSIQALLFLDLETAGGFHVLHGGAGLELGGFGLPIGAALSGGGGSNPVVSNLLSSGGSGGSSGDSQSVNPSSDLDIWYWDDPANTGGPLRVLIGGQTGLFWIPIHAGFGPIFIAEIGLGVSNTAVTLAIDGGVSIAGLTAQVLELSVTIPYAHVTDPSKWSLDLKGLAIGYSGPAVAIAGGLLKFDGPPVEYDGMLLIKIGTIGAVVIGSYSVVGSGADQYTSFAIFGGVFVPIGLTPLINMTGIALGLGYNRRLIVPEDLNKIPDFMLVKALDRPEALAADPMGALFDFRAQTPPARGALWLAAGIRGTSFELVNITAVLYVALDKGVEVGLIGVARMALPTDDAAIVSIELALKARFSSAEMLFSVQAQLTDNSWLITRDCQLTGGFAFFMWFRKSQFLLTLGGYHPAFKPLPEYPVVPRLGFRWNFLGVVHIKGESYFALTNTAVMTGVRMEATYGPDWIQVWFNAYTDILISWDPFHYEVDVGVSVGARLRIRICFFACCTIEISVSVGASLHLAGPPFHGTVTADLGVTSVTVPFGDDAAPQPPAKHWDEFVAQYVQSGDQNSASVSAQVSTGLLPAEPAGAPVAPGTADQPWRLAAEWSFRTETRMPARGLALQSDTAVSEGQMGSAIFGRYDNLSGTYEFDLSPMHVPSNGLTALHRVTLAMKPENSSDFVDMVPGSNPADHSLELDKSLFRLNTVIGQVSEATYHFFPDFKPPAAANTLPALMGLTLDGVAGLHNASQVIPIGKLVDASNYRPLPFARRTQVIIGQVLDAGNAWLTLATVSDGLSTKTLLTGLSAVVGVPILGGPGGPIDPETTEEFAQLRADSGMRAGGYGPVAVNALTSRRSAPPVLSALAEGFTLEDVGIGTAPATAKVGEVSPVLLDQPRLRATMQRSLVSAAATPAVRTSIKRQDVQPGPIHGGPPGPVGPVDVPAPIGPPGLPGLPVVDVRNDLITTWDAPGFALLTKTVTGTPQPTRAARSVRTLRNPALGGAVGRAAASSIAASDEQVLGDGVTVRAGATQVWELPRTATWQLSLTGDSAVRVTELSTAGTVLADAESAADKLDLTVAAGCGMVAVTALGRPGPAIGQNPDGTPVQGRGAVTGAGSSSTSLAALGWQLGSELVQVGPTTLLARGAVVSLSKRIAGTVRGHQESIGMVTVTRALLAQEVVQTDFGPTVTVVGVLVDSPTAADLGPDSVVVHTDGARLGLPLQVSAGNRTLFLYDIRRRVLGADQRDHVSVTVGLLTPPAVLIPGGTTPPGPPGAGELLNLAGVIGAAGTAATWAAALNDSTLTQLVADEHLTADGSVLVTLAASSYDHPGPAGAEGPHAEGGEPHA